MAKKLTFAIEDTVAGNPGLMKYWDSELNEKKPETILATSIGYAHFRCPDNPEHQWMAGIRQFAKNCVCPWCDSGASLFVSSRKPKKGMSLQDKCPELALEWAQECNGSIRPSDIFPSSHGFYWWHCFEHDIVYCAQVYVRSTGAGCPLCRYEKSALANTLVDDSADSIAVKYPELAEQWCYELNGDLKPTMISGGSGLKIWWTCDICGENYQAYPYRRIRGAGHRECATHIPYSRGSLAYAYPEVAKEWDYEKNGDRTPDTVPACSDTSAWFICSEFGHSWCAVIDSRTNGGTGCPVCAGKQLLQGFNDLETICPEIAAQWHPTKNGDIRPCDVTYATQEVFWWICYEHETPCEWAASVSQRTTGNKSGCPACGSIRAAQKNAKPLPGESLAELYPEFAREWHPTLNGDLTPHDVKGKSHMSVWWLGECGHKWFVGISSRVIQNSGCPICGIHTSFPENAMFYYIKLVFSDAVCNATKVIDELGAKELDVWIPSIKTGAEYDGQYWHQDTERDLIKDNICANNGIRLIRLRESNCPDYDTRSILVRRKTMTSEGLDEAIADVICVLGYSGDIDIDIERDRSKILSVAAQNIGQ